MARVRIPRFRRHLLVLAGAFSIASPLTAWGEALFEAPFQVVQVGPNVGYPQGCHARVADLDLDGHLDLLVATHYEVHERITDIDLLMGDGTGSHFEQRPLTRISGSLVPVTADLDGDHIPDVIVPGPLYESTTVFLRGTGQRITLRSGEVRGLEVGDLNADGNADIAILQPFWPVDSLCVFFGIGHGAFGPRVDLPPISGAGSLAVGDLNADGAEDLVVNGSHGTVLLGHADGSFTTLVDLTIVGEGYRLVDLNADHRLDLVGNGEARLGGGDGSFGSARSYGVGGVPVTGDFNEDGVLDLVIAGPALVVLTGHGDGTFGPPSRIVGRGDQVEAGDLDEDGHLDLVVGGSENDVAILTGHGDGTFGSGRFYPTGDEPNALATGDLNRDGALDLVVVNRFSANVSTLLGAGDGSFVPGSSVETPPYPGACLLRDLNGDGAQDLVVGCLGGLTSVFLQDGRGGFGTRADYNTGFNSNKALVAVGDIDEDGNLDLVAAKDGGISILRGVGGGAFASPVERNLEGAAMDLILIDVNGDGHLDLICSSLLTLLGDGHGSFHAGIDCSPGDLCDTSVGCFVGLAVGDFDADCHPDVVSSHDDLFDRYLGHTYKLTIGFGGANSRCAVTAAQSRKRSDFLALGDFDGDGKLDGACATWQGTVFLALGDGAAGFREEREFGTGQTPLAIVSGDFNGDGRMDLATACSGSKEIFIHLNLARVAGIPSPPTGLAIRSAEAALDLSWQPVRSAGLSSYRVYYGSGQSMDGDQAQEGRSGISIPAIRTSMTLHCLPDSLFSVMITSVDQLGRETLCAPRRSARPDRVGGAFRTIPQFKRGASRSPWITTFLRLSPGFSPSQVVISSVRLNGIPATDYALVGRDDEISLRFPRADIERSLQESGQRLFMEGSLLACQDTLSFAAKDSVDISPRILASEGGSSEGVEQPEAPLDFDLHALSPNPTRGSLSIAFDLPRAEPVSIRIFDIRGRLVSRLLDRLMPAGRHRVSCELGTQSAGLYFVRMDAAEFTKIQRISVVR
jgi:hypothetical protein